MSRKNQNALVAGRVSEVVFSHKDVSSVLRKLSAAALSANALPSGNARLIGQLTSPTLAASLDGMCKQIRTVLDAALLASTRNRTDLSLPEAYVDALDSALELAHTALDNAEGFRDAPLDAAEAVSASKRRSSRGAARLQCEEDDQKVEKKKPQLDFYDYPIDNSDAPFVPPFGSPDAADASPEANAERHLEELVRNNGTCGKKNTVHPYEAEIAEAVITNTARVSTFDPEDVIVFRPLKDTPFTFVDTEKALMDMAERLAQNTQLAVDIENHSERSFFGFTCLIQISTRKEDFVIDAIKLRVLVHRALAPIFADPTIVKVLHGADSDVEWLERDFGIYVVNLFDTGQAARILCYPLLSLSYLLAKFCDVKATNKKKMQRSDWRERPLPKDKLDYARSDTHFLLYIYDRLRAELAKAKKLPDAYERSATVARRRFQKPTFNPGAARRLAAKHGLGLDPHQIRVLEELCRWRDITARELDESVTFVLSNSGMFAIVRARDAARTPVGIIEAMKQKKVRSSVVREKADVVSRLISDALDAKIDPEAIVPLPSAAVRKRKRVVYTSEEAEEKKKSAESEASNENEDENVAENDYVAQNATLNVAAKDEAEVPRDELVTRKSNNLPEVEVKSKRVSVLWQDDSSSDESEREAASPTEPQSFGKDEQSSVADREVQGETMDTEAPQSKPQVESQAKEALIVEARKSVFDLSDSESDEDSIVANDVEMAPEESSKDAEKKERQIAAISPSEKVANVLAEIEATSRASLLQFSSLTESPPTEIESKEAQAPEAEPITHTEAPEPVYFPLNWRTSKPSGERKKKRKIRAASVVDAPPLAPFDYAAAAVQARAEKGKRTAPEPFDVLAGLKPGRLEGNRPKRPKKSPASGSRSMSFKARKGK